jgi:hypothetical protein
MAEALAPVDANDFPTTLVVRQTAIQNEGP